jgi:WD repeat-containing protein 23
VWHPAREWLEQDEEEDDMDYEPESEVTEDRDEDEYDDEDQNEDEDEDEDEGHFDPHLRLGNIHIEFSMDDPDQEDTGGETQEGRHTRGTIYPTTTRIYFFIDTDLCKQYRLLDY